MAVCQDHPHSREDQFLYRCHVSALHCPNIWSRSSVSSSAISCSPPILIDLPLTDGLTLHTPYRRHTCFPCVPINTRRGHGITSYSIYAISARSSTSFTSGCCHQMPRSSLLVTVYHMGPWPVPSSHGGTASYFMIPTKSRLCSFIFMLPSHSQLFGA